MQSENVISTLNKSLTVEVNDDIETEFIERIQTYIDGQKWIKRPISLSPAICSQYGWKCIKSNLLECVTCGAKLSALEPVIHNFVAYKACIEKILSDLKNSHGKHCPWPLTPSPSSFVRMIHMPKEEALTQFLKHLKPCLSFQNWLPLIKEDILTNLGFKEKQILALCKMAGIKELEAISFGKSVVPLAATGWSITEQLNKDVVFNCKNCQRSVWCGSFSLLNSKCSENTNTDEVDGKNNNTELASDDQREGSRKDSEPPSKKRKISFTIKTGEPFDPLHEHRPWCLWIYKGFEEYSYDSSITDIINDKEKLSDSPGWKIFIKSLLKNIVDAENLEIKESPSKEHIRNVRNMLETWTDGSS